MTVKERLILLSYSEVSGSEQPTTPSSPTFATPSEINASTHNEDAWNGFNVNLWFYYRGKLFPKVSDLARKAPDAQNKKFLNYSVTLLTLSLFYVLPVAQVLWFNACQSLICNQLVIGYLKVFSSGAQGDLLDRSVTQNDSRFVLLQLWLCAPTGRLG